MLRAFIERKYHFACENKSELSNSHRIVLLINDLQSCASVWHK